MTNATSTAMAIRPRMAPHAKHIRSAISPATESAATAPVATATPRPPLKRM